MYLGKTLRFEDGPGTIVGVLPAGFQRTTAVWRPFREQARRGSGADVIARVPLGMSVAQARQALTQHALQMRGTLPEMDDVKVDLRSILAGVVGDYSETTTILAAAVGLILVIACVNVAGLLLARGSSRHAELATRASIGAGRSRLVRQLLTESVLLSIAGGALGVGLAWLTLDGIVANIPLELPADAPVTLNATVLLFSFGLSTLTGLVFGLFPALRLSRVTLVSSLAKGHRQSGSSLTARGGRLLIATEIAVAVVLLLGATLMIRSFARILSVDLGFEPSSFVTMSVAPLDPGAQASYYPALLEKLVQMPVVEAAGAIDHPPLGDAGMFGGVSVDGRDYDVDLRSVLPGYFQAMGQSLRRGRFLEARDLAPGQRVVLLGERGARTFFEGRDPIGAQLELGEGAPREVIGVVSDIKSYGPTSRLDDPIVYLPYRPSGHDAQGLTVVVRPRGSSPTLVADLTRAAESNRTARPRRPRPDRIGLARRTRRAAAAPDGAARPAWRSGPRAVARRRLRRHRVRRRAAHAGNRRPRRVRRASRPGRRRDHARRRLADWDRRRRRPWRRSSRHSGDRELPLPNPADGFDDVRDRRSRARRCRCARGVAARPSRGARGSRRRAPGAVRRKAQGPRPQQRVRPKLRSQQASVSVQTHSCRHPTREPTSLVERLQDSVEPLSDCLGPWA